MFCNSTCVRQINITELALRIEELAMKKVKNLACGFCGLLCGVMLTACVSTVMASQDQPLKIWKQNTNGKMETFCVIDEDTGVNYIVVTGQLYSNSVGTAITPRLNADGGLYVSE